MQKPYKLMRRRKLDDSAMMRQWQTYSSYWTREEAENKKISMEMKGWECAIVGDI